MLNWHRFRDVFNQVMAKTELTKKLIHYMKFILRSLILKMLVQMGLHQLLYI